MVNNDWASVVGVKHMESFLKERLSVGNVSVQKRHNKDYGTYFLAFLDDYDDVLYFGSFGKLKIEKQNEKLVLCEDFNFSKENPLFLEEYIAFMHGLNKVDGKNRKLKGKTFISDFNRNYGVFLDSLEENNMGGER